MEFRPCIDIHNGKVKQIVGSSLRDRKDQAKENFVSEQDASYFAQFYKKDGIKGGHVILLNSKDSPYYEATRQQTLSALSAYPNGLQAGGGVCLENAEEFLDAGASHVIVTSFVFTDGKVNYENLKKMSALTGKERLTLDFSCRKRGKDYYIVTDRWQKFTDEKITEDFLDSMMEYADEFLVHAVDVEGKASGIERELVKILGNWGKIPITYAGGVGCFADLELLKTEGNNKLHVTIGSALDVFGGGMKYKDVLDFIKRSKEGVNC